MKKIKPLKIKGIPTEPYFATEEDDTVYERQKSSEDTGSPVFMVNTIDQIGHNYSDSTWWYDYTFYTACDMAERLNKAFWRHVKLACIFHDSEEGAEYRAREGIKKPTRKEIAQAHFILSEETFNGGADKYREAERKTDDTERLSERIRSATYAIFG